MYNCIILNGKDNVATVTKAMISGEEVYYMLDGREYKLIATTEIPLYHKVALDNIRKGAKIIKYGYKIGYALCNIEKGSHVHIFNLDSIVK